MTLKKRIVLGSAVAIMLVALFALAALATDADIYFSSDSNGNSRVTMIQEGDEVWICVLDPDENIDCDVRDKIWTDIKIMDPKTGAYIVWDWDSEVDEIGDLTKDYLEETGADTGKFVSKRAFQVGTRENFVDAILGTHALPPEDFTWGNYSYLAGTRGWFDCLGDFEAGGVVPGEGPGEPPTPFAPQGLQVQPMQAEPGAPEWPCGRFENMDTLITMYQDPNDAGDVAVGMTKIIDTEATISWGQEVYKDANASAKITIVDADENINCNKAEYVPVFIIVNPGSWNPVDAVPAQNFSGISAANFCMLKRFGGVDPAVAADAASVLDVPIRWYNIYDSGLAGAAHYPDNNQPTSAGAYYIEYPTDGNVTSFETTDPDGFCRVMFYAKETGVDTGVFELPINSLLVDLGFDRLDVRDVLVAYYLDPNDFDDFKLATAYIEERQHSITSFTDATRMDQSTYWIGRDPVYVQVIDQNANVDPCCPEQVVVHICDPHEADDSEWIVLDETTPNSPVFLTFAGTQLWPVWDALGVGLPATPTGGYQLQLDNWKLEVYNEDSVYVRYNDVYYTDDVNGMLGLGDINDGTAFPPQIDRIRVDNDVSFDVMEIADTQVFDAASGSANMYFLDRQGKRVMGYVNSDCVFVEVIDSDQDEDQYRRERIDGFWDGTAGGGQNLPFGPWDYAANHEVCEFIDEEFHPVNDLLGDTNIFSDGNLAKLYVLNPRNGRWAAVDLLEDGVATGDFVSVTCIDLVSQYECLPMLGVLPGDTIVAVYQDPSNHSDSAWISIKVGIGGGGVPPGQASTTKFTDAEGNVVTTYIDVDDVYVKVSDPSHAGADTLTGLEVEGIAYDLSYLEGANTDTFITEAISMVDLGAVAGDEITATYTDPTDPLDTSSHTVSIEPSELVFEPVIKPNPFDTEVTFSYGMGPVDSFTVTVYDASGHPVAELEGASGSNEITWDGAGFANGPYLCVMVVVAGEDTHIAKGTVFINK